MADHAIARHYPEAAGAENPYRAFLDGVIARQADLVAKWLLIGFIHGVMNTDNCSIAGETIDYGPCAFMDAYDPGTVFSSIDHQGRYAYGNQPRIALWNLTRLAECLLPLLDGNEEVATRRAGGVRSSRFRRPISRGLRRKIGLLTEQEGDDEPDAGSLLKLMAADGADFTLTFRRLCDAAEGPAGDAARCARCSRTRMRMMRGPSGGATGWRSEAAPADTMRAVNPAFIPRNHLVEAALAAAVEQSDFQPFEQLLQVLSRPYHDDPTLQRYTEPPMENERVLQTFCGT